MKNIIDNYKKNPGTETLSEFLKAYYKEVGESYLEELDQPKYIEAYRGYIEENYPEAIEIYKRDYYEGIFGLDGALSDVLEDWETTKIFSEAMVEAGYSNEVFNTLLEVYDEY